MKPQRLGSQRSFGFGDRFGLAGAAVLAAVKGSGFAPVLAQQSPRELAATGRSPAEVLAAVGDPVWPWAADADAVTSADQARAFVTAGFTRLTIDPSEFFVERADTFSAQELAAAGDALVEDGVLPRDWLDLYPARELPGMQQANFTTDDLRRAAVKLGWGLAFSAEIVAQAGAGECEIELSLIEAVCPTSPLEHWFAAQECRRRGVALVAVAPRLPGSWEAVAGYDGDTDRLEHALSMHTAIAAAERHQVSIPGIESKDAILPLIGRVCGERLQVKTSALSSLIALRDIARRDAPLFRSILVLAQEAFPLLRDHRTSVSEDEVRCLPEVADSELEAIFFGDFRGRQLLEATVPNLWARAALADGVPLRQRIAEHLVSTDSEYLPALEAEYRRLFGLLSGR
jgi:hypothetical protein